jgi:hypothetical protein
MDAGNFTIFIYIWLISVVLAYIAGWYQVPWSLRIERRP